MDIRDGVGTGHRCKPHLKKTIFNVKNYKAKFLLEINHWLVINTKLLMPYVFYL